MKGNESKSPNEQLAQSAADAQIVLWEMSSVAFAVSELLYLVRDCTHNSQPKFIDAILSGTSAILKWQSERSENAANSLDEPGAGR